MHSSCLSEKHKNSIAYVINIETKNKHRVRWEVCKYTGQTRLQVKESVARPGLKKKKKGCVQVSKAFYDILWNLIFRLYQWESLKYFALVTEVIRMAKFNDQ